MNPWEKLPWSLWIGYHMILWIFCCMISSQHMYDILHIVKISVTTYIWYYLKDIYWLGTDWILTHFWHIFNIFFIPVIRHIFSQVGWDRTGWEAFKYMLFDPDNGTILTRCDTNTNTNQTKNTNTTLQNPPVLAKDHSVLPHLLHLPRLLLDCLPRHLLPGFSIFLIFPQNPWFLIFSKCCTI